MRKVGVIIAVEQYQRQRLASAEYARADAQQIGEVFKNTFGVAEPDLHWFLDADATSGSLRRELRELLASLPVGCHFYFYYAGYGFDHGQNWLGVFDTVPSLLHESALPLEEVVFDPLARAECEKAILFLDLRTAGLNTDSLRRFVEERSGRAVFMSCAPGETSLVSHKLGHGVWSWHLAKALRGELTESLTRDRAVTGELLQRCLASRVKAFLRHQMTVTAKQSPLSWLGADTLVMARSGDLPRSLDPVASLNPDFRRAYWRSEAKKLYKRFTGFSKTSGHFIPTRHTTLANQFAEDLASEEAQEEINTLYENCVKLLQNKRSEIDRGLLSVDCEQFRFSINVGQDPEDPARVWLVRKIEFPSPMPELPEDFDQVFPVAADQLVVPFAGNLSYRDMLEKFEVLEVQWGAALREVEHGKIIELRFPSKVTMRVDFKRSQICFYKANVRGVLRLMRALFHDLNELGFAVRLPILAAPSAAL